ncbi:MAG: MerR family transcriptional regulator [Propionibacteriaceae bacterium]|nr:MerR family transcriptional regulator [Propionibacteriaceae bacterium]
MQLQALADASGTSVASIKYYRREGLLAPGRRITATRQEYGPEHVARLHLIQALREVLDAPIPRIRAITEILDDPSLTLVDALAEAQALVLGRSRAHVAGPTSAEHPVVAEVLGELGWPDIPSQPRQALDDLLHQMGAWGAPTGAETILRFARAMEQLARVDLERMRASVAPTGEGGLDEEPSADLMVIRAVVGMVAHDRLMVVLRALALASLSVQDGRQEP